LVLYDVGVDSGSEVGADPSDFHEPRTTHKVKMTTKQPLIIITRMHQDLDMMGWMSRVLIDVMNGLEFDAGLEVGAH
jgi:hypothetical protein